MNKDRIIALAGIYQATALVKRIARYGSVEDSAFKSCITSVLTTHSESTEMVYGGLNGVSFGLQMLLEQSKLEKIRQDNEITKYSVSIIYLQNKLAKRAGLMQELTTGIEASQRTASHFDTTHDNVISGLADTYSKTISTLTPKIIVSGEQCYLSSNFHVNRIRALLLCAIRSAVLWRQNGGKKHQLVFSRKNMIKTAAELHQQSLM